MLERDYITELISQFIEAVTRALKLAVEKGDPASCQEVEQQVADLIDLDVQTAMALSPDSLVTMLVLSGHGRLGCCRCLLCARPCFSRV